jgi:hypothetical protein
MTIKLILHINFIPNTRHLQSTPLRELFKSSIVYIGPTHCLSPEPSRSLGRQLALKALLVGGADLGASEMPPIAKSPRGTYPRSARWQFASKLEALPAGQSTPSTLMPETVMRHEADLHRALIPIVSTPIRR